jgi:hypothetical protein
LEKDGIGGSKGVHRLGKVETEVSVCLRRHQAKDNGGNFTLIIKMSGSLNEGIAISALPCPPVYEERVSP